MLKILCTAASVTGALALSGCASMTPKSPTPEQRAACEKMMSEMGEGATHSHTADKSGAVNTMGLTHAQCRAMLNK
jgi:predicted aconitase